MRFSGYVAVTDRGWYDTLSGMGDGLDEINFWRPKATTSFHILHRGEPLLFKLKKRHGDKIVGFGFYLLHMPLSLREAWALFGVKNGVENLLEFQRRTGKYTASGTASLTTLTHRIGCLLLSSPVFFPEHAWVDGPADWSQNIVSGKSYDLLHGEGARLWRDCLEAGLATVSSNQPLHDIIEEEREELRFGKPRQFRPRLGQGTFRLAVRDAYQQCAVTGEHAYPALDAAHIRPFAMQGPHEVSNGLLLRADLHRLFDGGYLTFDERLRLDVSPQLDAQFGNGKLYYAMQGKPLILPGDQKNHPDPEQLAYHREHVFLS